MWLWPGTVTFEVRAVDVRVARPLVFVGEIGVQTVLTQPVAAPHLVKRMREHDI
jgi:hypothetical protein